ncbi:hypothetical protein ABIB25_002228 [Nakamurella sp. UYEF19]|uniref:polysaccharide lyase n=1 Tax=Nakamurella sp. UYEF19 TaxID=1756392 RepID=UPI003391CF57
MIDSDFNRMDNGPVTGNEWDAAVAPTPAGDSAFRQMKVVDVGAGHGKVIRTSLKGFTFGTANGAAFTIPLSDAGDKACITYQVRFDASFDWSDGGKLPGLQGTNPLSGTAPAGGARQSDGWSGRMMWVGPGAYSWAKPTNMAVSYMYGPAQTAGYGDNVRWERAFQPGVWHTVKQCYTMNTPGRADGVLEAWMDGVKTVDNTAWVYRLSNKVHVNQIGWSVFRGGNTLDWAGARDGYIDIDNLLVTKG